MRRRVTLKTVAEAAGVSVSAASMALRDHPRISAAKRTEIRQIAAKLGYIYNRSAANLRKGHSNALAVCVNDLRNPVFTEFLAHIERECRAEGMLLLLCNSHENVGIQSDFAQQMVEHGAAGLLLSPAVATGPEEMQAISSSGLPVVLFSRQVSGAPAFDCVRNDDVNGVQLAMRELHALGHRRIAWIGGGQPTTTARDRLAGYRASLTDLGLAHDPRLEVRCPQTSLEAGRAAMDRILDDAPDVTAACCFGDLLALGAIAACKRRGLVVGQDISIVGHDDIEAAAYSDPALTTICVRKEQIGQRAARMLLDRFRTPDLPVREEVIAPFLTLRDTTGPAPLQED